MPHIDPVRLESRNTTMQVGDPFRDSVEIPGFERYSTWGLDESRGSYWVTMWRNDQDPDGPAALRLGAIGEHLLPRPECALVVVSRRLELDPLTVARGLGLQTTRTWSRSLEERQQYLTSVRAGTAHLEPSGFDAGRAAGAAWLAGAALASPVMLTRHTQEGLPDAPRIHAELLCVSGFIYLGQADKRLNGIDDALAWAISSDRQ